MLLCTALKCLRDFKNLSNNQKQLEKSLVWEPYMRKPYTGIYYIVLCIFSFWIQPHFDANQHAKKTHGGMCGSKDQDLWPIWPFTDKKNKKHSGVCHGKISSVSFSLLKGMFRVQNCIWYFSRLKEACHVFACFEPRPFL